MRPCPASHAMPYGLLGHASQVCDLLKKQPVFPVFYDFDRKRFSHFGLSVTTS